MGNGYVAQALANYFGADVVVGLEDYDPPHAYNAGFFFSPGSSERRVYAKRVLVPLRIPNPSESIAFQGMLLQVASYLEREPEAECAVYLIRPGVGSRRTLTDTNEINQLFQGRSSAGADRYPGDAEFKRTDQLTVQIHRVTILNRSGDEVFVDVPAVAVWVPTAMSQPWIMQAD